MMMTMMVMMTMMMVTVMTMIIMIMIMDHIYIYISKVHQTWHFKNTQPSTIPAQSNVRVTPNWFNQCFLAQTHSAQDQLYEVKEIAGSYGAFAALRNDGAIITWGDANYGGVAWMPSV